MAMETQRQLQLQLQLQLFPETAQLPFEANRRHPLRILTLFATTRTIIRHL